MSGLLSKWAVCYQNERFATKQPVCYKIRGMLWKWAVRYKSERYAIKVSGMLSKWAVCYKMNRLAIRFRGITYNPKLSYILAIFDKFLIFGSFAGMLYHWRVCYQTERLAAVCGKNKNFQIFIFWFDQIEMALIEVWFVEKKI